VGEVVVGEVVVGEVVAGGAVVVVVVGAALVMVTKISWWSVAVVARAALAPAGAAVRIGRATHATSANPAKGIAQRTLSRVTGLLEFLLMAKHSHVAVSSPSKR
jgi:hypothetical protein